MDIATRLMPLAADPAYGWGHGWGHGGPWFLFGPLMLVLWVAAIGCIVWFLTRRGWAHDHGATGSGRSEQSATDRAREILAERYARGEISTEEYRERMEQLW